MLNSTEELRTASDAPVGSSTPVVHAGDRESWWKMADVLVLGIWVVVVGFTLSHHEKWADEAQAWLIARDLDLRSIWFKELRYEGSPGLWHSILWVAQHVFHAGYAWLGIIGVACATAGAVLILFKAPFPRPLRWMLIFSYFISYQYAVVARPYVLLPLFSFAAAMFFNDAKRPERITVALILLSLLTLHGAVVAAALGLAYLIEAAGEWSNLPGKVRRRYFLCIAAMVVTFAFLYVILKPTPDVSEFVVKNNPQIYHQIEFPDSQKATWVISGAVADFLIPSLAFLLLIGAWCYSRRRLLSFVAPTALLISLYVFVHGFWHHQGTVFVAIITGLWIAWPTTEQRKSFTNGHLRALQGMSGVLGIVLAINVFDASVAMDHDYKYPYSGAADAASYLKFSGAVDHSIYGYSYGAAGVQAYFNRNILSNIPTSYYHHGLPFHGRILDSDEIEAGKPEYLMIFSSAPETEYPKFNRMMDALGYDLVHVSEGYIFFKRTIAEPQDYFIYRRRAW